jgi:hypothetical protein
MSGYLLLPGAAMPDAFGPLLARGWEFADAVNCPDLPAGSYFAVESETASAEGYLGPDGRWLVSASPLPEEPYLCRKISRPTFIQEVK